MNNEGFDAVSVALRDLRAMRDRLEMTIKALEREQMVKTPPPPPLDVRGITKHGGFPLW